MKLAKIYSPFLILFLFIISCKKDTITSPDKYNYDSYYAQKYLEKGDIFDMNRNVDSAFYYYNESARLFLTGKETLSAGYPLVKMAYIQKQQSDYFGGEATATEALKLLKNINTTQYKPGLYATLAMCYKERYSYDDAIYYNSKAYSITKDSIGKCVIKNNMANVYVQKKEYKKAITILKNLLESDSVHHHLSTKAAVLSSLAGAFHAVKNDSAYKYMEDALKIRKDINEIIGVASCYNHLGEYYSEVQKDKAVYNAKQAYDYATRANNPENRIKALHLLIKNSSNNTDYATQYIALQDSMNKVRMLDKTQFAKIKYDSKSIQKDNIRLQKQDAMNKTQKAILLILIFFTILTALLIYYIQRLRHKKAKVMEVYNAESRISKKIHDELANDIFNVMSFAQTQEYTEPEKHEKLMQNLDKVYSKTRDISRENNTIDTGINFGIVLKEMLSDYNTPTTRVTIINFACIQWDAVSAHKKISVYRVLQEMMVNMKKHSEAGIITLLFGLSGNKINIQYSDNGKGIKESKLFYKNGLKNAENRILAIDGTITFDNTTGGLKVSITFPA
ncbi:ATP-binding protein [Flavobacterium sp. Sd200]|uniref:tetratricopeptide repeat-containing sensor histidine kinase n=1 Tax=Flavobacterium sp. Sd200 TaxID=2692211 RepID=UPI00136D231E|nr:tetratricopeptide repeat-containing sensor histidine kinase [Flavobacterium sp. Sd200]MXN91936.1 ATP-binding protein [Flavobacterium sp. Sd200]